jgi:hypothetical protein
MRLARLVAVSLGSVVLAGCSGTTTAEIEEAMADDLRYGTEGAAWLISRYGVHADVRDVDVTCEELGLLTDTGDSLRCEADVKYTDGRTLTAPFDAEFRVDGVFPRLLEDPTSTAG